MAPRREPTTPAEFREALQRMTDDEIVMLLTYFRIGVLSFLEELRRKGEAVKPTP
jgi:hypothetical protein